MKVSCIPFFRVAQGKFPCPQACLSVQAALVSKKFRANAKLTNLSLQIRPYNGKKAKGATSAKFYFGKIKFGDFLFPNRLRLCKYCSACFNIVGEKRKKQLERNKQKETNRQKQLERNNFKETIRNKQIKRNGQKVRKISFT